MSTPSLPSSPCVTPFGVYILIHAFLTTPRLVPELPPPPLLCVGTDRRSSVCSFVMDRSAKRRVGVDRWCARGSSIAGSPGRRSHPLSLYPSRPILTSPLHRSPATEPNSIHTRASAHNVPSRTHALRHPLARPDSRRPRQHHPLRDHHPLRVHHLPLLRARRVRARCGMAREQGAQKGVGRFCGGGEARVVEARTRAGADAVDPGAASVAPLTGERGFFFVGVCFW